MNVIIDIIDIDIGYGEEAYAGCSVLFLRWRSCRLEGPSSSLLASSSAASISKLKLDVCFSLFKNEHKHEHEGQVITLPLWHHSLLFFLPTSTDLYHILPLLFGCWIILSYNRSTYYAILYFHFNSIWSCLHLIWDWEGSILNIVYVCKQHVDVPVPTPKSNEVLLKLEAASINPIDWKIQKGMLRPLFLPRKFPHIPGMLNLFLLLSFAFNLPFASHSLCDLGHVDLVIWQLIFIVGIRYWCSRTGSRGWTTGQRF